jgi:hypothetical protein
MRLVDRTDIHGRPLPKAVNRGGFGYWRGYLYLLAVDVEIVANSLRDHLSAEALKERWSIRRSDRPMDSGVDRAAVVVRELRSCVPPVA